MQYHGPSYAVRSVTACQHMRGTESLFTTSSTGTCRLRIHPGDGSWAYAFFIRRELLDYVKGVSISGRSARIDIDSGCLAVFPGAF